MQIFASFAISLIFLTALSAVRFFTSPIKMFLLSQQLLFPNNLACKKFEM
jgi:hypothetical protein